MLGAVAGRGEITLSNQKLKIALLARFELVGSNGPIDLPNKKLAGLLAYLACTAPVPQTRERLANLLWGSHFETQARQNLRQALFRLRQTLGKDALVGDGEEIRLVPGVVDCDVARLEALTREGSRASLAAAVDLYKDHLLADVVITEEAWAEWVSGERHRLEELALGAMVRLGDIELAAGQADKALELADRALAINDLREDAHRLILRALAGTGRRAEALKRYEGLVERLKRELDTEPDAATKTLASELRAAQAPSGAPVVKKSAKPARPKPQPRVLPPAIQPLATRESIEHVAVGDDVAAPVAAARATVPERRQLTIVACQLLASMTPSVGLDPEDIRDQIVSFEKSVAGMVARFDGLVAQSQGDRVLAFFGYPVAHEDDVERAVRAGLAIIDAIRSLKVSSGATFQARVGMATGMVVVDEHVSGNSRQHIAIGEAPNLAVQLQAVAAPGEVVIAASTRQLVGRMFDCRALAASELKGLPPSLEAWQVRGEAAGVTRFEARRAGKLSELVGRQEEMELLRRRWNQAQAGEGRVVLLSGEAGIGKSRIVESLVAEVQGEAHTRIRYFCSPHHTHSPLYPFIAQLEQATRFEADSSASAKLDKLEALLRPNASNLSRDLGLIADLLSVPTDGRYPVPTVSPQQKREMTLAALLDQLDGIAAQSPVLIVFEDIHWIDPTSLDLLDRTVARVAELPVLLIATFRPEFQPAWVGEPHVTMLPLSRLGRRHGATLVAGLTKGKALPQTVVEQILARTDGVPLFIEELTHTLLENGILQETDDGYRLDGPLPPLAIPTTLQASLVARLDRLSPVKDVAQIGATIGREFSYELIAPASGLAPEELEAALERLTAAGLISRRGTPPAATYAFKHALVQEATYSTLLKSRRRQLHATIAKVLVERFTAQAVRLPEVVAHHYAEAGLSSEAIGYWRQAGQLASARSANREAVSSFERALSLLEALQESQATLEQGFDLRLELRAPLIQLGEVQRNLQNLREAEALAQRLNDDRRRGRICAFVAVTHSLLGELDDALVNGRRALEIAERLGDLRTRILATSYLVQSHYERAEYDQAIELATGNLAALPADWVYENLGLSAPSSIFDRTYLVKSLAEFGRFAEAAEHEAEAIRLAEPTQYAYTVCLTRRAAGWRNLLRGDWAQARSWTERWVALARTGNVALHVPWTLAASAWALAEIGETGDVLDRVSESERLLQRQVAMGIVSSLGWAYHALARASLRLDRLDAAQRLGCLALKASDGCPGYAAHALHLLGDVATHPDRFDAVAGEAHYRKALTLAEPRGMRPLVANTHLGLGKLCRRTGKHKRARQHLTTATTMYREMDMQFWLQHADAEMCRLA